MRALSQVLIVYIITAAIDVRLNLAPQNVIGVVLVVMLGAALFATFLLIITCLVKTRSGLWASVS